MFAVLIASAILVTGCAVDVVLENSGTAALAGLGPNDSGASTSLPALGPVPEFSHWHAAYIVRICDDVLAPLEDRADSLGIHTHGDGIIHIHPFAEQVGYANATLGVFADAVGMRLGEGELALPGGGVWRDGDLCDGVPARVFVDRWSEPDPAGSVERIFGAPDTIRFNADGELYQIAFAPVDSPPVVPPSAADLHQVSALDRDVGDPWVDVPAGAGLSDVRVWPVAEATAQPCQSDQVSEQVRTGEPLCFTPDGPTLAGADAIESARAVVLNRQPAVELTITPALRRMMNQSFDVDNAPVLFAIEIDGAVRYAPQISRPRTNDRLVLVGGMTERSAMGLASIFNR